MPSLVQIQYLNELSLAKDESARTGLPDSDVAAAIAFREKALKERAHEGQQKAPPPPAKARDALREREREQQQREEVADYADDEGDELRES